MALRVPSVFLAVALTQLTQAAHSARSGPLLEFPANQEGFKILQISDPQVKSFATDECKNVAADHWRYPGCDAYTTTDFIQRLLEEENPDLVVFSGDNINGSPDGAETLRLVFGPVIASGIPFAAVFGNHDEEGQMNRRQMIDWISSQNNSLAVVGPAFESGHVGNYLLQIEGSGSSGPAFNLWFLDSGDYAPNTVWSVITGKGLYDWIQPDQIAWYRQQSEQSEEDAGRKLDSIAFFHIPTPEFKEAVAGRIVGEKHEDIYCPTFNSGFMAAMKARGDVRVAAVGHDHVNDWCGVWQGIDLCYGGGSGYTTYGRTGWDRRARIYVIHENGTIETRKRLDDEGFSTIDQQELNGTAHGNHIDLEGYLGTQSVTRSGKTWQKWTSQNPHRHSRTSERYPDAGLGDHNYCRNPDGESDTIWCYTLASGSRWEYCEPEGLDAKLQGYRGTQNITRSGKNCQTWISQSPHVHEVTAERYPAYGLGDHNYCRNPNGHQSMWCFTMDVGSRWEFCDLQADSPIFISMSYTARLQVCTWILLFSLLVLRAF